MLPPFVPPAARAATESLPLITEFVRQRIERSSENLWNRESELSTAVAEPVISHEVVKAADMGVMPEASLPSITDFLVARPEIPKADVVAAPPAARISESHSEQSRPERSWRHVPDEVAQLSDPETLPEPMEGIPVINTIPIVNEYATQPEPASEHEVADSSTEAKWITEERNAFDWQSVADLAVRQNEERRAEDEWTSTNWDRGAASESEQVASLLSQIVRRVRAGELKVEATRGMSAESALAATLAALLRSED